MKRLLLGLTLFGALSYGQIIVRDHNIGAAIATPLVLPDVPVNDYETLALDIVNTGSASVTVGSATVSGLYYSLCCDSAFVLPGGQSHALTLQFAPAAIGYMTGALHINDQAYFIFGRADAAASLYFQAAAGTVQAHTGNPLILTSASAGASQLSGFLRNDTDTGVSIGSVTASGDWTVATAPPAPLQLDPGAQVNILLSPATSTQKTVYSGVVQVDQWAYAITAHPPSPNIILQVSKMPLASGQQASLSISFASAPDSATSGTVDLGIQTDGPISLTDPAVIFTATGTESATFASVAGQTAADCGGSSAFTFQTGTTAGILHVHAMWDYSEAVLDIPISPAPATIESVAATRESHALDLTLTGFDNTRTAGRFSFSFFDAQGAFVGNPVTADFTELFYNFFFQTDYNAGGMFRMTARFPVIGDVSKISAVQVDVANTAGDAQSSVTPFR